MEDFITLIQNEVKNDPLTSLNLVMVVFTFISFARLFVDLCSPLCNKNTDATMETLSLNIDKLSIKMDTLLENMEAVKNQNELINIQNVIERMDNYITQVHYSVCVENSKDNVIETDTQDSLSQEEQLQPIVQDKHTQLLNALKDGETVSMIYKKKTFSAVFQRKTESFHGYILKGDNNTEYNTPSHFSHAKKLTINDKIRSDNGWETVFVIRDGKKLTLNELISQY